MVNEIHRLKHQIFYQIDKPLAENRIAQVASKNVKYIINCSNEIISLAA